MIEEAAGDCGSQSRKRETDTDQPVLQQSKLPGFGRRRSCCLCLRRGDTASEGRCRARSTPRRIPGRAFGRPWERLSGEAGSPFLLCPCRSLARARAPWEAPEGPRRPQGSGGSRRPQKPWHGDAVLSIGGAIGQLLGGRPRRGWPHQPRRVLPGDAEARHAHAVLQGVRVRDILVPLLLLDC